MSQRLNRVASNFSRYVPRTPEIEGFGRRHEPGQMDDVQAGPPVLVLVMDEYTRMAEEAEREISRRREARIADELRRRTAASTATSKVKSGIPTRMSVVLPRRPAPAMAEMHDEADRLGRVQTAYGMALRCTCGCGAMVLESVAQVPGRRETTRLLGHDPKTFHLWRVVRGPRCIRNGWSFTDVFRTLEEAERIHREYLAQCAASRSQGKGHDKPTTQEGPRYMDEGPLSSIMRRCRR